MSGRRDLSHSKKGYKRPTPGAEKHDPDVSSPDEAIYKCTCDTPDASDDWICCDNDNCPIGWYHWECARVTEEPAGDWLCPRCSLKSDRETELLRQGLRAKMSRSPTLGRTAAASSKNALDRGSKGKQVVAHNAQASARKGTAVKKAPPKKQKPKWVGWIEITSEAEEEDEESKDAAREATVVVETKRTNARATRSEGRPTSARMRRVTSDPAAGAKNKPWMKSEEEDDDEDRSEGVTEVDSERKENVHGSNVESSDSRKKGASLFDKVSEDDEASTWNANPHDPFAKRQLQRVPRQPIQPPKKAISASLTPPETSAGASFISQTPRYRSSAPAEPDHSTSPFGLTVRDPNDVPSPPRASGSAAMVIDTEEQGWTSIITTVAPDGASSVDYWSYRTNTWCTIPLSAIRSTLPRLL